MINREELVQNNLKVLRLQSGKTAKDIEDWLGMGRGNWTRLETGRTSPSIRKLALIAVRFNVDLDSILGRRAKLVISWEETQVWTDPEQNPE